MSHYVARINIEQVDKTTTRGQLTGTTTEKREVIEVANIVVRASTTEDLVKKLTAHLALIDAD